MLLRRLVRHAARRLAADPEAREKAADVARTVAREAREIASADDRARAAGRSVRRALDRFRDDGSR